ncbi:MAG: 30S ribosomal protein S17 [Nitrospiraceae bacterium]|nr:30S ribosomal protein S17 [Nitrospiraceae bacterium]
MVNKRKVRTGEVVSNRMDKTVVVKVTREFRHPVYGKRIKLSKKYMAHDESNECGVGDIVRLMETRPFSKLKRWRVTEIVQRAKKFGEES